MSRSNLSGAAARTGEFREIRKKGRNVLKTWGR